MTEKISLKQLLLQFLKIGSIGFGGGMAVIALIEKELIKKRCAIPLDEFLHGIGFGQILGPFAVNSSIFIGYRLYGITGGILCATFFMLPSISLVIILSYFYFKYHSIPSLLIALKGIGPVVIALIFSAGWSMGRKAIKSKISLLIASFGLVLSYLKVNPVILLLLAGLAGLFIGLKQERKEAEKKAKLKVNKNLLVMPFSFFTGSGLASPFILATNFFKIGLVFFGGGFVLVPILHQQLVEHLGWLTQREFIDGVAISNLTPGPIAVLATFAGFKVYGFLGAIISTIFLFLPSIILMLIISKSYQYLKDWYYFRFFLDGVVPAVIGLIINAGILLSFGVFTNLYAYVMLIISFLLLTRFKLHPAIVLAIGAVTGIFLGL